MKNVKEKIIFGTMFLQSFVIGSLYLYSRMEKWNLEESLTVFLYPLFALSIGFMIVISVAASFIYFVKKIISKKKIYFIAPLFVGIAFLMIANLLFNEMKLRDYNFKKFQAERQRIVELVLKEELVPDDTGRITLPKEMQNDEMARGGSVYIVQYKSKTGIYFCTFSGVLESSAGFVYLLDDMEGAYLQNTISIHEQYADNWYFCGTD